MEDISKMKALRLKKLMAFFLVAAIVCMGLFLFACGNDPSPTPPPPTPAPGDEYGEVQKELIDKVAKDSRLEYRATIKNIVQIYDPEARAEETVFYGASNFGRWRKMEEDLAPYKVQNHAFGGSTDKDLVYWAQYALYPYDPTAVFFQTGSNDYVLSTAETDDERIKECMDYKKYMFELFHEKLPNAKFIVMSGLILPGRSEYTEITLKINEELASLCDEVDYMYFVDAEKFTYDRATDTYANAKFVADQIHLTPEALKAWGDGYISPMLAQLNLPKTA